MTRIITLLMLISGCSMNVSAQVLTLDSCRNMAERNNRQIAIGRVQKDIAKNVRKSARTKYLPRVSALGGYELTSREISILSNSQQNVLNNIGTTAMGTLSGMLTQDITALVQQGVITPQAAQAIQQQMGSKGEQLSQMGNAVGQKITEAFHTDTKQIFAASVMLTQPWVEQ